MSKFSIIIPIYNVESYIKKCLDSVVNQSYKNFECILVCDKSADDSVIIAKNYADKYNFKYIYKEKTGLSEARNMGIDASTGEYILFLDGDDYFEDNVLEILHDNLSDKPDLLRFQVRKVYPNKTIDYQEIPFDTTSGIEAFNRIINYHFIENAWIYCYKTEFYKKNKFLFMKNCIAEDFGLVPLIIAKARTVKSIDFIGYNYVQRGGSLMNNKNNEHRIKKMNDMMLQAKHLYKEFSNIDNNDKFIEFVNNSLIYYSTTLDYKSYKKIKKELSVFNVYNYILNDNLKRKIKKFIIKHNAFLYYNFIQRYIWKR